MANNPQINKPSVHVPKLKGPPKQYQQDGHWIVKPGKTAVLLCACGNRYLKTRNAQRKCLTCIAHRR